MRHRISRPEQTLLQGQPLCCYCCKSCGLLTRLGSSAENGDALKRSSTVFVQLQGQDAVLRSPSCCCCCCRCVSCLLILCSFASKLSCSRAAPSYSAFFATSASAASTANLSSSASRTASASLVTRVTAICLQQVTHGCCSDAAASQHLVRHHIFDLSKRSSGQPLCADCCRNCSLSLKALLQRTAMHVNSLTTFCAS